MKPSNTTLNLTRYVGAPRLEKPDIDFIVLILG